MKYKLRDNKKSQLTFSQLAVRWLQCVDPRMQVTGFQEALRTILRQQGLTEKQARQTVKDIGYRMIPDAFLIDDNNSAVYIFEVEDSNLINRQKLKGFHNLFWLLDEMRWELALLFLDRYAANWRTLPLFETDLFDMHDGQHRLSLGQDVKIDWQKVHKRAADNSWLFPFAASRVKTAKKLKQNKVT